MTILNLSGQQLEYQDVAPKLNKLKNLMDQRLSVWEKLPIGKKVKWVKSDKDPIMTVAYQTWKYLDNNFFGAAKDEYEA